jgi:hypothetical protein
MGTISTRPKVSRHLSQFAAWTVIASISCELKLPSASMSLEENPLWGINCPRRCRPCWISRLRESYDPHPILPPNGGRRITSLDETRENQFFLFFNVVLLVILLAILYFIMPEFMGAMYQAYYAILGPSLLLLVLMLTALPGGRR